MLHQIKLQNVGVAPEITFDFSRRLNIITGDNGLGKSFILDVAWWILSRTWPSQHNAHLSSGKMARPLGRGEAEISFIVDGKSKNKLRYSSKFSRADQAWQGKTGRPMNPGLVLYAMSDGSFSIWDPARNYWQTKGNIDVQERQPAYIFDTLSIWDGLYIESDKGKKCLCNGFLRDVETWRLKQDSAWEQLNAALKHLSPNGEVLTFGEPTRIDLEEGRDIPTLRIPYIGSVPVVYASAAVKRILSLAYCLVWAWQEHVKASEQLDQEPEHHIIFLIDEIEEHLHPKWQRLITRALMHVVEALNNKAELQLILTTHSPLVMASCEDIFTAEDDEGCQLDSWLDIDMNPANNTIQVTNRAFDNQGTADSWLTSPAFDLKSTRSPEVEQLLNDANAILKRSATAEELDEMEHKMAQKLPAMDDSLFMWRYMRQHRKQSK